MPLPRLHLDAMMRVRSLVLYQRDDCDLCDRALEVLASARVPEFESVFIDGDATLEAHYGERIPVLRDEDHGIELAWPFNADAIRNWLRDSISQA